MEYKRFLTNALRKEFDLLGIPIRLHIRVRKQAAPDKESRLSASKEKREGNATERVLEEVPSFAAGEDATIELEAEEDFEESGDAAADQEVQFEL